MTTAYTRRLWLLKLPLFALLLCLWIICSPLAQAEDQSTHSQQGEDAPAYEDEAPTPRVFLPQILVAERPDTFTLIDAALASGEIDDETALTYRVFATFGDLRLPARFWGDDSGVLDGDAVAIATTRFDTLSAATRALLTPFLVPPVYEGSWYDLRVNGQRVSSAAAPSLEIGDHCIKELRGLFQPLESAHFVVWYPLVGESYQIIATQVMTDLETRIYPALTGLLRAPLGDEGENCSPSDGRLDVYLAPAGSLPERPTRLAYTATYGPCKNAPTYMVILQPDRVQVGELAHEFMHMIQFAYNPADNCFTDESTRWWLEASANWAVDYFEGVDPQPDSNMEHHYVKQFLNKAHLALRSRFGSRQYGAYLWPFYVTHVAAGRDAQWMADFFSAVEAQGAANFYAVMDSTIDGGFAARWPEFALFNLNFPPVNHYERWDGLQARWGQWRATQPAQQVELVDAPLTAYYLGYGDPGSNYAIYDLGIHYSNAIVVDDDVRLLAFANTFVGDPHIRVQALVKITGQGWQTQDWSGRKWTVFCRALPAERVEELVLVISNSNWHGTEYSTIHSDGLPHLVASNLNCGDWSGAAHWEMQGVTEGIEGRVTFTMMGEAASVVFSPAARTIVGDELQLRLSAAAGSVAWSITAEGDNPEDGIHWSCERSGERALTADLGELWITERLDANHFTRRFYGAGLAPVGAAGPCPGLESWTNVPWLQTGDDLQPWESEEGAVLRGTVSETVSDPGYSRTTMSSWDLAGGGP